MINLKHILVPTDFSDSATAALAFAKAIAAKFDSELYVLHVNDDPLLYAPTTSDDYREESEQKSLERLAELFTDEERQQLNLRLGAVTGPAPKKICEYAEAHEVDLIVMGSLGRTQLADMLMGSVTQSVMHTTNCPVMTVKRPTKST